MQAAAEEPGIDYSITIERDCDGFGVGVRFSGLADGSHAELFAQYILSLLELNGIESSKELAN
tara:strand:- start:3774 stop:3962 length:189 start_codon:yes stop_codon:yes gene_type:complete